MDQIHISSSWLPTTLLSRYLQLLSVLQDPQLLVDLLDQTLYLVVFVVFLLSIDYPMIRHGFTKSIATLVVFGFSALFHEVVISVPFRYFALHAFFGMLAQAPLVAFSKYIDRRFDNPVLGHVMLCYGQRFV